MAKSLRDDLLRGPGTTTPTPEAPLLRARGSCPPLPPRGPPVGRRFFSFIDLLERGHPFSRVHTLRLEKAGLFPKRVCLGSGNGMQSSVVWLVDEVLAWENERIAERGVAKPSRPSVLTPAKRANEADATA
jgi:predicted DNA-binding transcriptional regulator AlpA